MKQQNVCGDLLDKASTAMAKRYDTVIIEDFNIHGMQQNHHFAKNIGDVSLIHSSRN